MGTTSLRRIRWQTSVYSLRLWLIMAGCIVAWAVLLPAEVERIAHRSQVPIEVLNSTYFGLTTWTVLLVASPILVVVQLFLVASLGYFLSLFIWPETSFGCLWDGAMTASLAVLAEAVLHAVWFTATGQVGFQTNFGWLVSWGASINPFEMALVIWMFTVAANEVGVRKNRQVWLTACLTWTCWSIIKYLVIGGH